MEKPVMDNFLQVYQNLGAGNINTIRNVYRDDILFVDPAHEINGIENLAEYFNALYENVKSIDFSFFSPMWGESNGYVRWEMTFTHKKFNNGEPVIVQGASYLEYDSQNKVYFHRDYFDLGEMVYERIPFFGFLVASIKRRLGK